jgi:hypothetical protein
MTASLGSKYTHTGAGFSGCRMWRYWLMRMWDEKLPKLVVIGLNPSTADENTDDPTIRRCVGYAKSWGCGSLVMLNLFAIRATDPRDLKTAGDPVGRFNDETLRTWSENAHLILAAWGSHGDYQLRAEAVLKLLNDRPIHCLGRTKSGQPRHPLYLKADARPTLVEATL